MSYRKEKYRILAGSLNLLPPGDKTSLEDSLELTNWRVDQAGQLRSRRGMQSQTGYLAGDNAHTLFRQSPNRRFLGNGGFLYRSEGPSSYTNIYSGFDGQPLGMATQAGFTWVMNPAKQGKDNGSTATMKNWLPAPPGSAPVATAGAQTSKTLAAFESTEAWAVTQPNGDAGGSVEVVDATGGAIEVTNGSTAVTGSGTAFDGTMVGSSIRVGGGTYGVAGVGGSGTLTLDAPYAGADDAAASYEIFHVTAVFAFETSQISGERLHIACNPPGTWQADLAVSQDLGIIGEQRDDDKLRIWIQTGNPAAVDQVTVAVDVNDGGFGLDYYSVSIPGSALSQVKSGWFQVEIRRRLDAAGVLASNPEWTNLLAQLAATNDDLAREAINQSLATLRTSLVDGVFAFSRVGNTASKDWATSAALRITVQVNEAVDVSFDVWDVIGGVNGSLEGDFSYFVTFDTAAGHESNPSPESAAIALDKQSSALTGIPVSTDAQVTQRHIYRAGGALDGVYRVGTIPDNVTTTFTDAFSDEDAQTRDTRMPIDHDPPPAALGLIRHLGKLIAFNTAAHPGRFFWTPTAQPWYFPGADDANEGNWEDTGEDGDELLAMTSHRRILRMYKGRSIWRVDGDPANVGTDPEETGATVGLIGPRAVCAIGQGLDAFAGGEGIYKFNGEYEEKISHKVDPIFKGEFTVLSTLDGVAQVTVPPLNGDQKRASVLEHIDGRLYFSYVSLGGPTPDTTLVCDLETLRWYKHQLDVDNNGAGGFSALYYEGQDRGLIGALTTAGGAAVYQLETGVTDDGNAIPLVWHSRYNDQNLPDNEKVYADLVVVYKTGDQNGTSPLVVSMYFDNGARTVAIGTIDAGERTRDVLRLGSGLGLEHLNAAIRIEGDATTECVIYEAYLHWYVQARAGKSFDTGVIDLGTELVKQIDRMELELTAAAAGVLTWAWHGDLPGGVIQSRLTGTVAIDASRRNLPVVLASVHEGRKLRLVCTSDVEFQVHAARVSVLDIGQYVDGSAGETWVSKEIAYGGS